jgi:hypothetical protein
MNRSPFLSHMLVTNARQNMLVTSPGSVPLANGNNDNVVIGSRSFVRITGPSAGFTIRGIMAGLDGQRVVVYNPTVQNMTVNHEDAGSTAANRIRTNTGAAVATTGEGTMEFIYDLAQARWVLMGAAL